MMAKCKNYIKRTFGHCEGCSSKKSPVEFVQDVELTLSAGERPQAAHLLRSWVRIPPGAWMFVCCECCVLSGRVLCDELITRPEESYRLCCVVVCDLETSKMGAPYIYIYIYIYDISRLRIKEFCTTRPL